MSRNGDLRLLRSLLIKYPEVVYDLRITTHQMDIYKTVNNFKPRGASSPDIASWYGTTVQNASLQLNKLWRKGYLNRSKINSISGGVIFLYSHNIK